MPRCSALRSERQTRAARPRGGAAGGGHGAPGAPGASSRQDRSPGTEEVPRAGQAPPGRAVPAAQLPTLRAESGAIDAGEQPLTVNASLPAD